MRLNAHVGPPKVDIWIPDSQMDCFVDKNDFRQLGLILSEWQSHGNTQEIRPLYRYCLFVQCASWWHRPARTPCRDGIVLHKIVDPAGQCATIAVFNLNNYGKCVASVWSTL